MATLRYLLAPAKAIVVDVNHHLFGPTARILRVLRTMRHSLNVSIANEDQGAVWV